MVAKTSTHLRKMDLLYVALQIDSTQFIHCKELVDQHLWSFQPSNAVYIFNPASRNIQTHLDERLPCRYSIVEKAVQISLQARGSRASLAVFKPLKASTYDMKTEDYMETDEFYDGLKYLYNEDGTPEAGQRSNDHLRHIESNSVCPSLEPAPVID